MKVEIINREEVEKLFETWGKFSSICYNTPEKYATRVGKSCFESGHFSGSRGINFKFKITGISRACIDQLVRAEVGVSKNVMSGRYVDFSDFDYYTPPVILKNKKAKEIYDKHMEYARNSYKEIVKLLNEDGITGERAFEAARGVAPMNHKSALVISFTIEALINLMHKRLCVCAQHEIRMLAFEMRKEVTKILPELKPHLVAICEHTKYCPESLKRSCNRYPQKEVLDALVLEYKKNNKKKVGK